MTNLFKALILGILFALIVAIAALLHAAPWIGASWQSILLGTASFACFGFLLGGIYAFDPESELKIKSSSIGRMAFGIIAALLLSALWRWPPEAAALAALVGAVLAYLGMSWAKYADHF
jgi:hypothetical protein